MPHILLKTVALVLLTIMAYMFFSDEDAPKPRHELKSLTPHAKETSDLMQIKSPIPVDAAKETPIKPASSADSVKATASTKAANTGIDQTENANEIGVLEFFPKSSLVCNIGMNLTVHVFSFQKETMKIKDLSKKASWLIEKPKVARIQNGLLHCLTVGKSKVEAVIGGRKKTGSIEVFDSPIRSLSLSASKKITLGSLINNEVKVYLNLRNKRRIIVTDAKFELSDSSKAEFQHPFSGFTLLRGQGLGTVRLYAKWQGFSAYQDVSIVAQPRYSSIHIQAIDEHFKAQKSADLMMGDEPSMLMVISNKGRNNKDFPSDRLQSHVSNPEVLRLEQIEIMGMPMPFYKVIGLQPGETEVTISLDSLEDHQHIKVIPAEDYSLKLQIDRSSVRVGDLVKANVVRFFAKEVKYQNRKLQWYSSNPAVLAIEKNTKTGKTEFTARAMGEAMIHVSYKQHQASAQVQVIAEPTSLYFDPAFKQINIKSKYSPKLYTVYSDGYQHRYNAYRSSSTPITFSSSDLNVLKVDESMTIKVVTEGEALLQAHGYGLEAGLRIQVLPEQTAQATGISITSTPSELYPGVDFYLNTKIHYYNNIKPSRSRQRLEWRSSNSAVLQVNNGRIKALTAGDAVVTVQIANTNISSSQRIHVSGTAPKRLELEQLEFNIPLHATLPRPRVWAIFSDGMRKDVSKLARFSVKDNTITINNRRIWARKLGRSEVQIKYAGIKTTMVVHVRDDIAPNRLDCNFQQLLQLMVNEKRRLICSYRYANVQIKHWVDLQKVRVSNSDPAVIGIVAGESLLARAVGTSYIEIWAGSLHDSGQITVSQPQLLRRTLDVPNQLKIGKRESWVLREHYSNGLQRLCSAQANSSDNNIFRAYGGNAYLIPKSTGAATLHVYCKGIHYQKLISVVP
ncbi:MAG: hypothetical protein Q9M22_05470 [Mariprofundaceae bacterium]|nr:hypothetical protein [Mariprofundaceae bacterium]